MVGALMEGIYVIVYPHVWIESISESIRLFWRRQIYKVKGKRRRFSRATQSNPNLRKISSFRERERERGRSSPALFLRYVLSRYTDYSSLGHHVGFEP